MTTFVRSLTCERKVTNRMVIWVKVRGALNGFIDHGEGAIKIADGTVCLRSREGMGSSVPVEDIA